MEICPQRSVGILPAHTLRPATIEHRIATAPLATFTSSGLAPCEADLRKRQRRFMSELHSEVFLVAG
jgi:hypothetical protein